MSATRRLVPDFIIEKYKTNKLRGTFQGAAIFVDLSGFSKMTDALSSHGHNGAEALANLMRVIFEPLVTAVYEQGGFVIGYAGDAFNAIFPEDPLNPKLETKRCLAALVAMQKHMLKNPVVETPYGNFPIAIKSGMGFGETRWQMFKSETGMHLSYWLRGDSLNRAVHAEEKARPGEIIIDPVAHERIADMVEVNTMSEGVRIVNILSSLPAPASITEPEPESAPMNMFFPEALSSQKIVGEFRHVINLFIDIPLNISDETLVAPFMQTVYELQEIYGGFFLRPDLGDKGFNLLMFWGAPVAREHDVERALSFVMELATRTELSLRAGITYRIAYAGFMGASLREDYTAYGWGVNLAARLMEHAGESEFWLDEEIARRAEKTFNVKLLGDYSFKGFAKKQRTYRLMSRKSEVQLMFDGAMIGRQSEIKVLTTFSEPVRVGKYAGMLIVSGEAGMGKSRLLHEFQASNYFNDFQTHWVICQTEEIKREAFHPFKSWLRKRFKLAEDANNELNWAAFSSEIETLAAATPKPELSSELRRTASVLAALVNITQPDSLYETLDAKSRYENTITALSVLFRAESLKRPLYLFIEDIHWLDDATREFLTYFNRILQADEASSYPIAILATKRSEEKVEVPADWRPQEIALDKLTPAHLFAIAENILGKPITTDLNKSLDKRAEGNPFFAEQILRYLLENELLRLNPEGYYEADEKAETLIPVDVHTVMIARLDRLTREIRETIQAASILGREFVVDVLSHMLKDQMEKLPRYVHEAENADIWASIEEINYIFRHAMLRDAAYSMQLKTQRRKLHALAFESMLEIYKGDLEPYHSDLAYHAEKGSLQAEALHYLMLSGGHAMSNFQNRLAIDYYTRALAVLPKDTPHKEFDILLKRAECFYNIGESVFQLSDLNRLEELAKIIGDDSRLAKAYVRRALYASIIGDFGSTTQYATQARDLAQTANDTETLLAVYIVLPDALIHAGEAEKAKQAALDGIKLAQKIGNRTKEASGLSALSLAVLELEGHAAAQKYQRQALEIAQEVKDLFLEAKLWNNLALSIASEGDYHTAQSHFQKALRIFQEQGNQGGKSLAYANLGWLSSILGEYDNARGYYERALNIAREQGSIIEELYTHINLSASASGQGNSSEALAHAQKALTLSTQAKDRTSEAWAHFYLAHAELLTGNPSAAVTAFQKSLEIRTEANSLALIIESRAGLVDAYLASNDQAAAGKEAQHLIEHMEKDPAFEGTEEPLRIYLSLFNYLKKTKDLRTSAVLQNAIGLLNTQVSKLHSLEAQQVFIENVPWRRELQRLSKN
ncbi:MAG: tetratricopeptide repeat protein [Anaerolineales bacterium]|nr:tetratricopeptide repeat protein [Anaerolineales bacterium]